VADPKRVALACILAWVVPGSGHFYLGKRTKGAFFLCIVAAMFAVGLLLDGRVYLANRDQPLSYLATFANASLGPLDMLGRQISYQRIIYISPPETDRASFQDVLERTRARILSVTNEYGTTFMLTAGLMNILLILDAFDIGIGRKT